LRTVLARDQTFPDRGQARFIQAPVGFPIDARRGGPAIAADFPRRLRPQVGVVGHQLESPPNLVPVLRALSQSMKPFQRFSGQHWLTSVQTFFLEDLTASLPRLAARLSPRLLGAYTVAISGLAAGCIGR
jgi:hypothetical protein